MLIQYCPQVYREKEVGREMFVVVSGAVRLTRALGKLKGEREEFVVAVRRQYSFFGESALVVDLLRREHTVTAVRPSP